MAETHELLSEKQRSTHWGGDASLVDILEEEQIDWLLKEHDA